MQKLYDIFNIRCRKCTKKVFHFCVICKAGKILDHLIIYPLALQEIIIYHVNLVDISNLIHYLFNARHFHVLCLWQSMTVETICAIIFTQFQINYRHDFWRSFLMQQWFEICNAKERNKKCLSINFLMACYMVFKTFNTNM